MTAETVERRVEGPAADGGSCAGFDVCLRDLRVSLSALVERSLSPAE